jgi:hypothetical protein
LPGSSALLEFASNKENALAWLAHALELVVQEEIGGYKAVRKGSAEQESALATMLFSDSPPESTYEAAGHPPNGLPE